MVRVLLEPQYRIPRGLVHLEMGKAQRILTQNTADLAEWRRGVWDEKADWGFANEELRTAFVESVQVGTNVIHGRPSDTAARATPSKIHFNNNKSF
jgi:hypothetical protein